MNLRSKHNLPQFSIGNYTHLHHLHLNHHIAIFSSLFHPHRLASNKSRIHFLQLGRNLWHIVSTVVSSSIIDNKNYIINIFKFFSSRNNPKNKVPFLYRLHRTIYMRYQYKTNTNNWKAQSKYHNFQSKAHMIHLLGYSM